ncbi:class I SAM-dependent methyltransferase [Nonomuraea sp. NPDC001684]
MSQQTFTPALGRLKFTRLYDPVVALTRERMWRSLVAMHVAPRPDDTIVDVGCGTGSQAMLLHRLEPRARIIGVDPDPETLAQARRKSRASGTAPEWRLGMGDALTGLLGPGSADTAVSSLVLHQCPLPMKRAILASITPPSRSPGADRAPRDGRGSATRRKSSSRRACRSAAAVITPPTDGKPGPTVGGRPEPVGELPPAAEGPEPVDNRSGAGVQRSRRADAYEHCGSTNQMRTSGAPGMRCRTMGGMIRAGPR